MPRARRLKIAFLGGVRSTMCPWLVSRPEKVLGLVFCSIDLSFLEANGAQRFSGSSDEAIGAQRVPGFLR